MIRYFWFVLGFASFAAQAQIAGYRLAVDTVDKAPNTGQPPGYVFDITVQNTKQLNALFQRADRLRGQFSPNEHGRIALVLHGEELRLFQKSNYKEFMQLVDQARQLDSQNLIDIKACQTAMEHYKIDKTDLPDFIEQVPFAPIEIERLQKQKGYTRL